MFKVLVTGEIIGSPGVRVITNLIPLIKKKYNVDFIISGASFTTNLFGLGKKHALFLKKQGIDILSLGNSAFFKKDILEILEKYDFVLRPLNFPCKVPGKGWQFYKVKGLNIAVVNLIGQAYNEKFYYNSPIYSFEAVYEDLKKLAKIIIVVFNSKTTAEKNTLFAHLKSKVSICVGTSYRIPTADYRVWDNTGIVSDVGRVGSLDSILGLEVERELEKFLRGYFTNEQVPSSLSLGFYGYLFSLDEDGKCTNVEFIKEKYNE